MCANPIARDAVRIVGRLLDGGKGKWNGATIKALTLAPHVKEKKPTHAVVCRTLEHLSILKKVVDGSNLLVDNLQLPAEARSLTPLEKRALKCTTCLQW